MQAIQTTMGFEPTTLNNISYLQYILKTNSTEETIKNIVEISRIVLNQVILGNQIIIEDKAGLKQELNFSGLRYW